jgi:hypothetical protein
LQIASDVIRDGLGVELLSETGEVVTEVFRCDRDHTVIVNTFSYGIPLQAIEQLIARAKERLEPFEDGISLKNATTAAPQRVRILGKPSS